MSTIISLFRLDFRARVGTKSKSPADNIKKILNIFLSLIIYAILIVGVFYLVKMFMSNTNLKEEILVIITTITTILLAIVCTGNLVKTLYFSGDNELLLRFPVSGRDILLAKSLYIALYNIAATFLINLPFYVCYGVMANMGIGFYLASIGVILFSSFLPLFIANIIAIPIMWFVNLVKNQYLLILIFLIALITLGFILYMTILQSVVNYIQGNNVTMASPEIREKLIAFAAGAYPFRWYADMLIGTNKGLSFLYMFLITCGLGVAAYFTASKGYFPTILRGIETEKVSFQKKTGNTPRTQFGTLLRREWLLIFRSFNYSFQYLAMAVAAPVMVYFCNRLAINVGEQSVGTRIVPGLTLLVIIIFITIIVSFASTTISREGTSFYHTKIMPVSATHQVAVKLFLYSIVATLSVIVSCVAVYIGFNIATPVKYVTLFDMGAIFVISEMIILALTCIAIKADVKSPTFNVSGDNEVVQMNKNVAGAIFAGFVIAILFGIFAMVFNYLGLNIKGVTLIDTTKPITIYMWLAGIALIILVSSIAGLFVNLDKNYKRITP